MRRFAEMYSYNIESGIHLTTTQTAKGAALAQAAKPPPMMPNKKRQHANDMLIGICGSRSAQMGTIEPIELNEPVSDPGAQ